MRLQTRPLSKAQRRRFRPWLDGLEPRSLLSATSLTGAYQSHAAAVAQHAHDVYVSDLRQVELLSQATPAQYTALRDNARTLSAAVSSAPVDPATTQTATIAVTLLIDRSLLQGWLDDAGWNSVRSRMKLDLAGLPVPDALIDKTVSDMKAAAVSAGVDPGTYQVLISDQQSYKNARDQVYGGTIHGQFPDPQVYYTQHLRGFFRGWAAQKTADEATPRRDVAAAARNTNAGPGGVGVLNRDVGLLQSLGADLPSDAVGQLTDAFAGAFVQGVPGPAQKAAFRTSAEAALGVTATQGRTAKVDRLVADMPAFFAAAGSEDVVRMLTSDVAAVVNDGEGSSLNPFLITVLVGPRVLSNG
jgi:hypothetical protein